MVGFRQSSGGADQPIGVRLDSVVHGAELVFVGIASLGCSGLGVLFAKVCVIPLLHGHHRVILGGQSFLGADPFDPFVDGFVVRGAEVVEIGFVHGSHSKPKRGARSIFQDTI